MIKFYAYNTDTISQELLWFVAGLVAGILIMAVIDFVIDRSKK